jgi:hypothetical protein
MRLSDLVLTAPELTHLAAGAHLLAAQARADADQQASVSVRDIFERSETVYLGLADNCERLAKLATEGPPS